MQSETSWQDVSMPRCPKLKADMKCDVLVVGGGITGFSAAYLLKRAGKRVCLLERGRLTWGDTGCTTAHLTYVTDRRLRELVSAFGRDGARLAWEGGAAAINTIEEVVRAESIECEFQRVPGFLHESWTSEQSERKELAADCKLANELGFSATMLDDIPAIGKAGIRFANQSKFHPLKYLGELARSLNADEQIVFENSEASEFSKEKRSVTVNGKQVEFEYLVIATHVPLVGEGGILGATLFQTKLASYSSYAIGAKIPKGQMPEASFWDTSNPYYYLRIDRGARNDYAIFGGEDHKTGQAADLEQRFRRLEELLKRIVPESKVDRHWSGQVVETPDGLPYIGEIAEGQFVATGYAGNGMTFGTLAGMMACDAVLGRKNPWQDLFNVHRKKVRSAWDFVKENFDYPYYLLRDRLSAAEARSVGEVKRGEGKVLKHGGVRIACSRDDEGKLTSVSAICTHMGCVVHWNGVEKTWDCPCHGSRFAPTGEVIAGPAESPLEPAKKPVTVRTEKPLRRGSDGAKSSRRAAARRSR